MKHFILLLFMSFTAVSFSQILLNGETSPTAINSSAFLSASGAQFSSDSGFGTDGSGNIGKGLIFPRTDLTSFTFTALAPVDFPTVADGMIVYNNGTGDTPAPIAFGANSGIGDQAVTPGFYYFSNPGSTFDTSAGLWLPMGGADSSSKSTEVTGVVADGVTTTLDLGTATIAGSTVTKFISARIYDAAGDLVMEASKDYNRTTNVFVTGNASMNTLLPAGTYSVVVEYQ